MTSRTLSFVLGLLISLMSSSGEAARKICPLQWERLDNPPVLALSLDTVYYAIRYRPQSDKEWLKISSLMPAARYVSLTSYGHDANAFDSIFDQDIRFDPDDKQFHIVVATSALHQEGSPPHPENFLRRPSLGLAGVAQHGITLWYRVYAPYENPESILPPTVEVGSEQPLAGIRCPEVLRPSSPVHAFKVQKASRLPKDQLEKAIMDSFHVSADFDYQNRENGYLNARINFQSREQLAYFRMRAPKASQSYDVSRPDASWSQAQLRLYSLSVINSLGVTLATLNDSQLPSPQREDDGEYYLKWIVADPSDADLKNFANREGIGFLPRSSWYGLPHVLIYRQQAANRFPVGADEFRGHVRDLVPLCTEAAQQNPRLCAGRCFIGDYAPVGRLCSRDDFLQKKCSIVTDTVQACGAKGFAADHP